jgi:glycerophosphoryl diester phosphodiesterase
MAGEAAKRPIGCGLVCEHVFSIQSTRFRSRNRESFLATPREQGAGAMTYLVAHRGASFDAPENTLAAFRLAWEQGADGVEGDFMLTADGQIVCFHDLDTKRLAGESLVVKETALADLRSLDVGGWKGERWRGERMATLEEVLAVIPAGKKFVIELKDGPEIVAPLEAALASGAIDQKNLLIISMFDETVVVGRRQLPQVKWHWLCAYKKDASGRWSPNVDEVIATIEYVGAAGFGSLALPEHFDAEFVRRLRAAGIEEFHVWTVDDPAVARFYLELGAWGITTNRPGFLRAELGE